MLEYSTTAIGFLAESENADNYAASGKSSCCYRFVKMCAGLVNFP